MRVAAVIGLLMFLPLSAVAADNPVIASAQIKCNAYVYGSVEFRQCREEARKHMQVTCNQRKEKLRSTRSSDPERAEALADMWCDAAKKFK